jgi:protein-serine/threonine kinase
MPLADGIFARSSVMTEHEHGLGASGLRRIRQQPPPRAPTLPASGSSSRAGSVGPRASSVSLTPGSRKSSHGALSLAPSSPTLNFTEDLTRFPSESLHSFSFAHQSEEFIHNRQNVLKRSIEFMKDRLGWAASSPGIVSAQARVTGDQEMQSMLELLARANLMGPDGASGHGLGLVTGPLTGPAQIEGDNVFDRNFFPRSESPDMIQSPHSRSPVMTHKEFSAEPIAAVAEETVPVNQHNGALSSRADGSSEVSSRTPTDESRTTAKTSPPVTRRQSLKRTYTDTEPLTLQHKLMEAMAQPYVATEGAYGAQTLSPTAQNFSNASSFGVTGPHPIGPAVHGHASRWAPAAQAIFTTESKAPWTILAANDLACLVFGVTKAEVRKMGILEVVREERRAWLAEKLNQPGPDAEHDARSSPQGQSQQGSPAPTTSFLLGRGGLTASLLNKAPSRSTTPVQRRAQTDDGAGSSLAARKKAVKGGLHHASNKSRGVLLCGDVVPIQKRNGATGAASLWVKEKRGGLIWVLEEIHEDVAFISLNNDGIVTKITGSSEPIWGEGESKTGTDIGKLLPRIPRQGIDPRTGAIDYAEVTKRKFFTARNSNGTNIPTAVERVPSSTDLRISSFPHIAGIIVLNSRTLEIASSNSVFCAALFGQEHPDRLPITDLIPGFDRILRILTDEDGVRLVDGIVIPEHSFRRARAFLALRDGKADAATYFLKPDGLPAKHRDGSEIKIDVQMRVVKSESRQPAPHENVIVEEDDDEEPEDRFEVVYALWITYSRHLHASQQNMSSAAEGVVGYDTPPHQPSPGQTRVASPVDMDSDDPKKEPSSASLLTRQLKAAAIRTAAKLTGHDIGSSKDKEMELPPPEIVEPTPKKTIEDFVILEEMGQGAYGQVKLARYKKTGNKMVLKYVTKRRILVDTWTRDRRLGTVPLEIHVLDYLRRDGLKHRNIVEMADFFEDDVNYYIEMVPHGLPGMDLFDYIELRVNMEEAECKSIFIQVARAIHHLHTKALVVHRDIKDENVVLDGEGNIKLIDFGSAAYIKNGPFDVFVGTIGQFFLSFISAISFLPLDLKMK